MRIHELCESLALHKGHNTTVFTCFLLETLWWCTEGLLSVWFKRWHHIPVHEFHFPFFISLKVCVLIEESYMQVCLCLGCLIQPIHIIFISLVRFYSRLWNYWGECRNVTMDFNRLCLLLYVFVLVCFIALEMCLVVSQSFMEKVRGHTLAKHLKECNKLECW